ELETALREFIEGALVLEEHHLAERLSAGLQAHADLVHFHVTDVLALLVGLSAAMRCPDAEAALADGREYQVGIAVVEKARAFAAVLEQGGGVAVFVRGGDRRCEQNGREKHQS